MDKAKTTHEIVHEGNTFRMSVKTLKSYTVGPCEIGGGAVSSEILGVHFEDTMSWDARSPAPEKGQSRKGLRDRWASFAPAGQRAAERAYLRAGSPGAFVCGGEPGRPAHAIACKAYHEPK